MKPIPVEEMPENIVVLPFESGTIIASTFHPEESSLMIKAVGNANLLIVKVARCSVEERVLVGADGVNFLLTLGFDEQSALIAQGHKQIDTREANLWLSRWDSNLSYVDSAETGKCDICGRSAYDDNALCDFCTSERKVHDYLKER